MGERWYLRTMTYVGPLWYAGADLFGLWARSRDGAEDYDHVGLAREVRNALCAAAGIPRSAVRVVRVGPKRRPRAGAGTGHQGVDGGSDVVAGVQRPAARPTGSQAPAGERQPVTGLWCGDSPVHEHAWQWRDGGLVCAHCGGRRVEVKA